MRAARDAFLDSLIDYAGLFPPARQDLSAAVEAYRAGRQGPHRRLLGRFLCPLERVRELPPLVPGSPPLAVSAILPPAPAEIADLVSAAPEGVSVEALEVRLEPVAIRETMAATRTALSQAGRLGCPVFFESGFAGDWRDTLERTIGALSELGPPFGFKMRCGGLEPAAFPAVEQVAAAVVACRDAGIPFKATAGLHHPIRFWSDVAGTAMHGFVNLFGAAALARAHSLDEEQVMEILADEEPADFSFDRDRFSWKHLAATAEEVREARARLGTSFGSCSFDEPVGDLLALGILEEEEQP